MVLVNEVTGHRICCECHEVLERGADVLPWLAVHTGPSGCDVRDRFSSRLRRLRRRRSRR